MKKYLVLSFDDGTVEDIRFIEMLNKYNLKATFNLNSGLSNYVWYYDKKIPIIRLDIEKYKHIYDGHEVASHTKTHPILTEISEEEIIKEVNDDVIELERIFGRKVDTLACPFILCEEKEIEIIKKHTHVKGFRMSVYKDKGDYSVPVDDYHYKFNAVYNSPDLFEQIRDFANNKLEKSVFIILGHSYEFVLNNDWDYVEELLKYISSIEEIEVVTFSEAIEKLRS